MIDKLTIIVAFVAFIGQFFVLYMTYRMIKFAKVYSKLWAMSYTVFGIGMTLVLLRRAVVVLWGFGVDGRFMGVIQWVDHVVLPAGMLICWILFLSLLWSWWNRFFQKYINIFPDGEKISMIVDKPIKLIVEGPLKTVVDGDTIIVEEAKRVLVHDPQNVEVVKGVVSLKMRLSDQEENK